MEGQIRNSILILVVFMELIRPSQCYGRFMNSELASLLHLIKMLGNDWKTIKIYKKLEKK